MIRKSLIGAALIAFVNLLMLVAPAHAGGSTANCGPIPRQSFCSVEVIDSPGGTLAADFDVYGGSIPDITLNWHVDGPGGQVRWCSGTFRMSDPPQSWLCHGLNPGYARLTVNKDVSAHAWAGLRW
ncbi:hypothetical protein [Nocardia sp. NRRL S-836]|uniref:hypothetical protein n=1 Tax=Nocardia sp. NRRL S-836 TaxID=1519492 RepID=UPI0006AF7BF4|nr:hypothetical protein [Nocardia sp. NRRL S-836]KOV84745.1 hypothetical protein ADL03_15895 [Nocardia sp. NRRL S-836]